MSGPLGTSSRRAGFRRITTGPTAFRRNATLGRDDTNGRAGNELAGQAQRTSSRPELALKLTLLHVDLDNGYDGWSIDNELTTWSDRPGRDSQTSTGASLRADYWSVRLRGHSLVSITGGGEIRH